MRLLVAGTITANTALLEALRGMGHTLTLLPDESDSPEDPSVFEGIICNFLFQNNDIAAFTNLRYIQLTSAGLDRMPLEYIRAHGIELHNAKAVYSVPMAEFAVGGVLQLYKQSRFFLENQKQHRWEKNRGLLELNGKTVGIVGCGDVGTECAKRFAAFGCRVLGVNRTVRELEHFDAVYPLPELSAVLSRCDVAVLCIALTAETKGLMSAEAFAAMKSGAVLVNISRGAVADEAAMTAWLQGPVSGGAVLDVFEEEPLPDDSPLWDMDKVIVTPHNSFVGEGNAERMKDVVCINLLGDAT